MNKILIPAALFFASASFAFAAGTIPDGQYCSSGENCQSGVCDTSHTVFTFMNTCVPAAGTGQDGGFCTQNSQCSSGSCDTSHWINTSLNHKCAVAPAINTQAPPPVSNNIQTGGGNQVQTGAGNTGNNSDSGVTLVNPLGTGTNLMTFLKQILAFVVQIGTVVVIFMLVYVGYLFVAAQGAPAKIEEARRALLWTVVGALILLGAQAIADAIQATAQALSTGH